MARYMWESYDAYHSPGTEQLDAVLSACPALTVVEQTDEQNGEIAKRIGRRSLHAEGTRVEYDIRLHLAPVNPMYNLTILSSLLAGVYRSIGGSDALYEPNMIIDDMGSIIAPLLFEPQDWPDDRRPLGVQGIANFRWAYYGRGWRRRRTIYEPAAFTILEKIAVFCTSRTCYPPSENWPLPPDYIHNGGAYVRQEVLLYPDAKLAKLATDTKYIESHNIPKPQRRTLSGKLPYIPRHRRGLGKHAFVKDFA